MCGVFDKLRDWSKSIEGWAEKTGSGSSAFEPLIRVGYS